MQENKKITVLNVSFKKSNKEDCFVKEVLTKEEICFPDWEARKNELQGELDRQKKTAEDRLKLVEDRISSSDEPEVIKSVLKLGLEKDSNVFKEFIEGCNDIVMLHQATEELKNTKNYFSEFCKEYEEAKKVIPQG